MIKSLASLMMLAGLSVLAVPMYDCQNILVKNKCVEIAPKGNLFGAMDFKGGASAITVNNFENMLNISFGEAYGEPAFTVTKDKDDGKTDTAWEISSKPFKVTGGKEFVLVIRSRGTLNMRMPQPYKGNYNTAVRWFGKDGKQLENQDFAYGFEVGVSSWRDTYIEGTVPPKAATAVILLGADSPNVNYGEILHISRLELMEKGTCAPEASFVSAPHELKAPMKYHCDCRCPSGTSVDFKIATAPDKDGVPGEWTDFRPPRDPIGSSAYPGVSLQPIPDGHKWVRYQCTMKSAGGNSPILRNVTICDKIDNNWTMGNNVSPILNMLSHSPCPDDKMTLRFRLDSNTVVDVKNMAFTIDGIDCKQDLKVDSDGVFFYIPQTPWAALPVAEDPSKWTFNGSIKDKLESQPLAGKDGGVRIFSNITEGDTFFRCISPYIQVTPGTTYSLAFSEHHNLVIPTGAKHYNKVEWFDKEMKRLDADVIFPHAKKAEEWTQITAECKAPENAERARITIGFDSPNIYKGYYFDLGKVHFKGADGKQAAYAYNYHTVCASGKDIDGLSFNETCAFLIGEPRKENIITMRDDGFMLVDGKPFFPIGIAGVCKRDFNGMNLENALQGLKDNGFNFASSYVQGDALEEYLTAADKVGMVGYVSAIKDTANVIMRFRHHKSAFSWYIGDDTSSHIPYDVLRNTHRLCHALDNSRPTSQADVVHGTNYTKYVHSTDVFRPELYPVRDVTPTNKEVPQIIRDMKTCFKDIEENGSPIKSVWGIVQYFDGWKAWKRFPTFEELRAMSWLTIIHGSQGITWYTYGGFNENHGVTSTPERWENMGKVSREIASLQHELTNRHAAEQPTVKILEGPVNDTLGYPSVSCLLKSDSDVKNPEGILLLTASSSFQPVKAQIVLPKNFVKATVLSENREVKLRGNELVDEYAPYGVHLYRLK